MNTFSILTYAIIAMVIVGLAIALMISFFPQEDIFDKIKDGVEISQNPSNFGKYLYIGKLPVEKDLIITKTALNIENYSLAVECNDPNKCCPLGETCNLAIEWDYERLRFKRTESIPIYTRCGPYFDELVCRVYFGKKPAQAKIDSLTHTDNAGKINTILKVTNVGNSELLLGLSSLKIYKKVQESWKDTEMEFASKEIDLILPNQKHTFVWETNLLTGGTYKLEFKFEGLNSGYDTDSFELLVGENQHCFVDESKIEIQDYNTTHIRTIKYCAGCNYGYECLAQWLAKTDGNNYDTYGTNSVQYIREMDNAEQCDRELDEETGYFSLQGQCIPGYQIIPVSTLTRGICCIRSDQAEINPCETNPDSPDCLVEWLPNNEEYLCPLQPDLSAFGTGCNVNEWFNVTSEPIE